MAKRPRLEAPTGACDCHIHVYGDKARYPSLPVRDLAIEDRYLAEYLDIRDRLRLDRTVIIQSPHYDTDNSSLIETIAALGQERARGIAVTRPDIAADEIARLHDGGVRGVRFGIELARGMRTDHLEAVAERIAPFGWHIQYRSTDKDLADLAPRLAALPVPIVIDHIASIPPDLGTDHPAFKALLRLLDGGRCWVKLSAPYQLSRSGGPAYEDYRDFARALVAAAPERMVWGTNWPHPKVEFMPDDADLLDTLLDWVDDDVTRRRILVDNPAALYGFAPSGP